MRYFFKTYFFGITIILFLITSLASAQKNSVDKNKRPIETPVKIMCSISPEAFMNWNKILDELEKSLNKEKTFMNLVENRFMFGNDTDILKKAELVLTGKNIRRKLSINSDPLVFDQLPHGTYSITLSVPSVQSFIDQKFYTAVDTVIVLSGNERNSVELAPSLYWINLHGKVVDSTGKPIAGALIKAVESNRYLERSEKEPNVWTTITDLKGCYTLAHLPPDDIFEIGRLLLLNKPVYNNAVKIYVETDLFSVEPRLVPLISDNLLKGGRRFFKIFKEISKKQFENRSENPKLFLPKSIGNDIYDVNFVLKPKECMPLQKEGANANNPLNKER